MKVTQVLKTIEQKGVCILVENCNCGDQIRHNNGGNYHAIVKYSKGTEPNEYYEQWDDSSELTEAEKPRQVSYQEMRSSIVEQLKNGLV